MSSLPQLAVKLPPVLWLSMLLPPFGLESSLKLHYCLHLAEYVLNSVLEYLNFIGSNSIEGKEDNLSLGTDNRNADQVKKLVLSPLDLKISKERTLSKDNNKSFR